jgi:hypothetical protein
MAGKQAVVEDEKLCELAVGLLTAAPKNVAIVAATTLVALLQEGHGVLRGPDLDLALQHALKATCLVGCVVCVRTFPVDATQILGGVRKGGCEAVNVIVHLLGCVMLQ